MSNECVIYLYFPNSFIHYSLYLSLPLSFSSSELEASHAPSDLVSAGTYDDGVLSDMITNEGLTLARLQGNDVGAISCPTGGTSDGTSGNGDISVTDVASRQSTDAGIATICAATDAMQVNHG